MPGEELPTARDYELFLLSAMVQAPDDLVDQTLRRVGASRDAMWTSRRRVDARNHVVRPAFDEVSRILGRPLSEEMREEEGRRLLVRRFPLQLWDDFDLEVHGTVDGVLWNERFVRSEGSPVPQVDGPDGLLPWRFTVAEVRERFGSLQEVERWPPYASFSFDYVDARQGSGKCLVAFSWDLLQSVETGWSE